MKQDDLLKHLENPDTIRRAAEASMEKRERVLNPPIKEDEGLRELYSDENISATVRDILRETYNQFDEGSDEFDENLKSRYMLLAKRIRDSHNQSFAAQKERWQDEAELDAYRHAAVPGYFKWNMDGTFMTVDERIAELEVKLKENR